MARQLTDSMTIVKEKTVALCWLTQSLVKLDLNEAAIYSANCALEIVTAIISINEQVRLLEEVVPVLVLCEQNKLALSTVQNILKLVNNTTTYDHQKDLSLQAISLMFVHIGEFERAFEVASSIEDPDEFGVTARALNRLTESLTREEEYEYALEVAKSIEPHYRELRGEAFCYIVWAFARIGKINQASQIVELIDSQQEKLSAISVIAYELLQKGDQEQAQKYVNLGLNILNRIEENGQVASVLTDMAQILAKSGKVEEAIKVAKTIQVEYAKASAIRDIIYYLIQERNVDYALQLINLLVTEQDKISPLRNIIEVLMRSGEFERAFVLFDYISDTDAKVALLSYIMDDLVETTSAYCNVQKYVFLLSNMLLNEIKNLSRESDKIWPLRRLAERWVKTGDVKQSLQLLTLLDNDENKDHVLVDIVRILAYNKEFDLALQIAKTINTGSKKDQGLHYVVTALLTHKKFTNAVLLANTILDEVELNDALREIASYLADDKQYEYALEIVTLINKDSYRRSALSSISRGLVQDRQFDQALTIANMINDGGEKDFALASIVRALAQLKEFDRAIIILKAINDDRRYSSSLADIVIELADAKNFDRALEIAGTINYNYDFETALAHIITSLMKTKETVRSLQLLSLIEDEYRKQSALYHISKVLLNNGDFEQAIQIIEENGNNKIKAEILSDLIYWNENLISLNQSEQVLCKALFSARLAGREMILKTLKASLRLMFSLDQGQTLLGIYNAIIDVESWWSNLQEQDIAIG